MNTEVHRGNTVSQLETRNICHSLGSALTPKRLTSSSKDRNLFKTMQQYENYSKISSVLNIFVQYREYDNLLADFL